MAEKVILLPVLSTEDKLYEWIIPGEYTRVVIHKGTHVKILDVYKDKECSLFKSIVCILEKC